MEREDGYIRLKGKRDDVRSASDSPRASILLHGDTDKQSFLLPCDFIPVSLLLRRNAQKYSNTIYPHPSPQPYRIQSSVDLAYSHGRLDRCCNSSCAGISKHAIN